MSGRAERTELTRADHAEIEGLLRYKGVTSWAYTTGEPVDYTMTKLDRDAARQARETLEDYCKEPTAHAAPQRALDLLRRFR